MNLDDNNLEETDAANLGAPTEPVASKPNTAPAIRAEAKTAEPTVKALPLPEPEEEVKEKVKVVAYNFFINRLKQLDKALFEYKLKSSGDKH